MTTHAQPSPQNPQDLDRVAVAFRQQIKYSRVGILLEICGFDLDKISDAELAGWMVAMAQSRNQATDEARNAMERAGQLIVDAIDAPDAFEV